MNEPVRYLIIDVGSTTTKALLLEPVDGDYRLAWRGEAGTTVEAPDEDVMVGVRAAVADLSARSGHDLLAEHSPGDAASPVTEFLATSSAGGGLQILVCGLVKNVTAESAERAALGAGAVLLDVISVDDGRPLFERLDTIRRARPDMILLAGGVDGAASVEFAVEFADLLNGAKTQPRFGQGFRLPVIYAGNNGAAPLVADTLDPSFELHVLPNLRPGFQSENLQPARQKIHEIFLGHVMEQAPGYANLKRQTDAPILPTPVAVGRIMSHLAERDGIDILGADIGGATTDIFSVVNGVFSRTVSANLGMSYSAGNVLISAGRAAIRRWLPYQMDDHHLADAIATKVIHPTTIPATLEDLLLEQALAREALSLSLQQHLRLTVELPSEQSRWQQALASQGSNLQQHQHSVDLSIVELLVGSGGVLSHAPRRAQAALMLLDAFQPVGYTFLAVDSIFMMPHLGVLTQRNPTAALHVLDRDCLIKLGPSFCLHGFAPDLRLLGQPVLSYHLDSPAGVQRGEVAVGDLQVLPLPEGVRGTITLQPHAGADCGAGRNARLVREVEGGAVGVMLDCRGRPLTPRLEQARTATLMRQWMLVMGALTAEESAAWGERGTADASA